MSSLPTLELELRAQTGKGAARSARRSGYVPGTLYGQKSPVNVQVLNSEFIKEMKKPGIFMRTFNVKLDGNTFKGLVRDIERDRVSELPLHFDIQAIDDKTMVRLSVPLRFINREKCPGLKRGGVLSVIHHTLEVKCLAKNIVSSIEVDLNGAPVGKSIRFADITLPEGMKFTHQRMQDTVYTIVPPKVKGKDAAAAAEEGAA